MHLGYTRLMLNALRASAVFGTRSIALVLLPSLVVKIPFMIARLVRFDLLTHLHPESRD